MAFGIGLRRLAQGFHGAAQANGAQHIREPPARWHVITNVVGGKQPRATCFRQSRMMGKHRRVIAQ